MNSPNRTFSIAVAASLLLHGLLVWSVMRWGFAKAPPAPPRLVIEMLAAPPREIPPPPPPQPRPPEPVKPKAPVVKTAPAATAPRVQPEPLPLPAPAPVPEPAPQPGPPQHKMKSASAAPGATGVPGGGTARKGSVYAPPDYAEKVKTRVNAAIVYPADAKRFLQQCWVEYTLTVDRNGNMLSYKIDNCGDDRLDAAAQAALIKGGPYPPPPDTGASSYEIHGALVFTLR